MRANRKFYFLGFAIYLFSFFLPALSVFDESISGYKSALLLFGSLLKSKGFINHAFIAFANLANILPLVVFMLQFRFPFKNLIILQLIAFISAFFWVGFDLFQKEDMTTLYIGYWNWLFGIFIMLISMLTAIRGQKKK